MDNFPLQMLLFGFADRFMEPFCYGCAGFVLSYRLARALPARLFAIALTILCFLWMDDIWPALWNRTAQMAMASENRTVADMFAERQQVGRAEFKSGEQSGLWDILKLDVWDVGSAIAFVPLAFFIGGKITRQVWREERRTQFPPPPPGRGSRPPLPPV